MSPESQPIILYDGICGLCHRTVRFLIRRDRKQLRYAPLQGTTAASLRALYPQIPQTLESVVLVDGGTVYLRSKALFYAARYLTLPWRWAYQLRWMPVFLTDFCYRRIAHLRYRVWGQLDSCSMPTTDERSRQLP